VKLSDEDRQRLELNLDQLQSDASLALDIWRSCQDYGLAAAAIVDGPLQRVFESGRVTPRLIALMVEVAAFNGEMTATELARHAASKRLEKDPRQKEKRFVFDCWSKWQENPANYKSQAAFARDMLEKCAHLTSHKKIEDWCREWKKR
jgi:hypothetical protein